MRAVLFDVDGTLVLSNDAHARAWVEAFAAYGHEIDYAQVRSMIGMGGDKIIPKLCPGLTDERGEGKQIAAARKAIFLERFAPHLRPAPGARELLLHLRSQGLKLVVASSAQRDELSELLRAAAAQDLFDDAATSSDSEHSKPDPDVVRAALKRSGAQAPEAFMVGDTPYDVSAARKAGLRIIAVRCGGWDDTELRGAEAVYEDPAQLLAAYDTSPLGKEVARNL